ncbi:ribose-phosphate pyrophosphokinase [Oscillospiraceae bacterium OttesenSCG-928-F05]|nr:ribose-phosphate pyrophosphokinase [Oscillospiraceae bacterium OttesenSCG-928-F05]
MNVPSANQSAPIGDLSLVAMRGCESFVEKVDRYLNQWRGHGGSYILRAACPRFGSGEAKGMILESVRGHDMHIICDVFNYGVTYPMYGMDVPMSPDDHFQDLKRIIGAAGGKPRRISLFMPMLYEGRQHRRGARESLDCAVALQELVRMGVTNIITFDAHDPRVQNAIPYSGFDNVQPVYQMIKALLKSYPDMTFSDNIIIVSPDEGGLQRCMYYASVLGTDLGMFYKRRNYSMLVDGRNPIVAHEYLGSDVNGRDVVIIDDMISSGESILDVSDQLKRRGARRVFVFSTFGLFCNGLDLFDKYYAEEKITKIFTTNLNYRPAELIARDWYQEVDMSKYVAYLIDALNLDHSISKHLDPVDKINALLDQYGITRANT